MEIKDLIENSNLKIDKQNILYNEPMKKHTSFKVGGPAECLVSIKNLKDLQEIITFTNKNEIPLHLIGNGSNILVLDEGIKGITAIMKMEQIEIIENDNKVEVIIGAGYKLAKLAQILLSKEITGVEELSGIPGTIGGAIRMNAGAHGKEMKDILESVTCIDKNGDIIKFINSQLEFDYRTSIFSTIDDVIVEAKLILKKGNKQEIKTKMEQYANYRKEKQPIEYPSAGSTFKRGKDYITAALIQEAGLKGYSIGDAEVSIKHSGFIINKGNATAKDILELIKYVKKQVKDKFNKDIELEVEIIGEKENIPNMV